MTNLQSRFNAFGLFDIKPYSWLLSLAISVLGFDISLGIPNSCSITHIKLTIVFFVLGIGLIYTVHKFGFQFQKSVIVSLLIVSLAFSIGILCLPNIFLSEGILLLLGLTSISIITIGLFVQKKDASWRFSIIMLALGFLFLLIYTLNNLFCFSPDSYAYYGIAQSFLNNFGDTGLIRQYVINTELNVSFPYLYPLILLGSEYATNLKLYAGVFINVLIAVITAIVLIKCSIRLTGESWCGAISAFVLLSCPSYLDEVCAVRAIPLALLFTICCIWSLGLIAIDNVNIKKYSLIVGLTAGACACTRFDGLALVIFVMIAIAIILKRRMFSYLFICAAGMLLPMLPWIIYSFTNFGTIWVSDNSGTFLLVESLSPRNVNATGVEPATIFNSPSEWFVALGQKCVTVLVSFINCSIVADAVILFFIICLFLKRDSLNVSRNRASFCLLILFLCLMKTIVYILVGYEDVRYHVETLVLVTLSLSLFIQWCGAINIAPIQFAAVAFGALLICVSTNIPLLNMTIERYSAQPLSIIGKEPEWISELDKQLDDLGISETTPIFVLQQSDTFYGWTLRKTYVAPLQLNGDSIREVINRYSPPYILVSKENLHFIEDAGLPDTYESIDLGNFILLKQPN